MADSERIFVELDPTVGTDGFVGDEDDCVSGEFVRSLDGNGGNGGTVDITTDVRKERRGVKSTICESYSH